MKKFILIFVAGMAVFFVVNFVSDTIRSDGMDDPGAVMRNGFPWIYQTGPDYPARSFSQTALLADIGLAALCSGATAALFSRRRRAANLAIGQPL